MSRFAGESEAALRRAFWTAAGLDPATGRAFSSSSPSSYMHGEGGRGGGVGGGGSGGNARRLLFIDEIDALAPATASCGSEVFDGLQRLSWHLSHAWPSSSRFGTCKRWLVRALACPAPSKTPAPFKTPMPFKTSALRSQRLCSCKGRSAAGGDAARAPRRRRRR